MFDHTVVVRGGGDLGSGVALRLWRSGFRVVILETACPLAVRRLVSFSEAVYDGESRVEEVSARSISVEQIETGMLPLDVIAVVVDPAGRTIPALAPRALVDAIMAKRNTGTGMDMAPLVVALGPGFVAGVDVDAVVETNRGPFLGRVLWQGEATANTGFPGEVQGKSADRVLRAPCAGVLVCRCHIGDIVNAGDTVADVAGVPIVAGFRSMIRGLARDGLRVEAGTKVGDIDPRLDPALCTLVSDKSLAVAGGALEAILMSMTGRAQ